MELVTKYSNIVLKNNFHNNKNINFSIRIFLIQLYNTVNKKISLKIFIFLRNNEIFSKINFHAMESYNL